MFLRVCVTVNVCTRARSLTIFLYVVGNKSVCICRYISSYMYIYIYNIVIHRNCFAVSQLSSVARHMVLLQAGIEPRLTLS